MEYTLFSLSNDTDMNIKLIMSPYSSEENNFEEIVPL